MKLAVYQKAVTRTLPNLGESILGEDHHIVSIFLNQGDKTMNLIKEFSLKLNLAHMALGVASEMSELEECLNYSLNDLDFLDETNMGEEIGDKMWYGCNWANLLGMKLEEEELFFNPHKLVSIGNKPKLITAPYNSIIWFNGMLADIAKRFLAYNTSLEVQESKRLKDYEARKSKHFFTNEQIIKHYIHSCYCLALEFDLDIEKIMGKNIVKLYVRYEDKFTEDEALTRDLEAERLALEGNAE